MLPVSLSLGYVQVLMKSRVPSEARARDAPEGLRWPGGTGPAVVQQGPSLSSLIKKPLEQQRWRA